MPHSDIKAKLTTELITRWNLPGSQLFIDSMTERSLAKEQKYMRGIPHRKNVHWEGGHRTYFLKGGAIVVENEHMNTNARSRLPVDGWLLPC